MAQNDAQLISSVVVGAEFFSDSRHVLEGHVSRPAPDAVMSYDPKEIPRMYPLELRDDLTIWLWAANGSMRWRIAEFVHHPTGDVLQFVGSRPFNPRVNWAHFREMILQAYSKYDARERAKNIYAQLETDYGRWQDYGS